MPDAKIAFHADVYKKSLGLGKQENHDLSTVVNNLCRDSLHEIEALQNEETLDKTIARTVVELNKYYHKRKDFELAETVAASLNDLLGGNLELATINSFVIWDAMGNLKRDYWMNRLYQFFGILNYVHMRGKHGV